MRELEITPKRSGSRGVPPTVPRGANPPISRTSGPACTDSSEVGNQALARAGSGGGGGGGGEDLTNLGGGRSGSSLGEKRRGEGNGEKAKEQALFYPAWHVRFSTWEIISDAALHRSACPSTTARASDRLGGIPACTTPRAS
jgi:hypothetical protein